MVLIVQLYMIDRKTFPDLHDMLSTPPKKLIPLRPFSPKIAIGTNPPLTDDFKNLQSPPQPPPCKILGGFPL